MPRFKRNKKKTTWATVSIIFVVLIAILAAFYFQYIYKLSGDVLYFFKTQAVWQAEKRRTCTPARVNYSYADRRPETLAKGESTRGKPLDISCPDTLKLPHTDHYAMNPRNMRVHYVRYASPKVSKKDPILFFIPGIASNYISGARYYGMAERLKAELIIMEATNHGWSDDDGKGAAFGCREKDDVVAVIKEILKAEPERKMYIFTTSMGGMTLTNALPQLKTYANNIFGVTLENPPSALRDVMVDQARKKNIPEILVGQVYWLAEQRARQQFTPCTTVKQAKHSFTPTQVTVTPNDHLVPVSMAKKVFNALPTHTANDPKAKMPHVFKIYPYGGHSIIWNGQPEVFEADLKAFWDKSLRWHQSKYQ